MVNGNNKFFFCLTVIALTLCVSVSSARAACTNPAGDEGNMVYNTTHKTMQFCDGTNWFSMKGGAVGGSDDLGDHTATQALNMGSNLINNVTDPSAAQDAATKAYVDGVTGANENDPQVGTLTSGKWCTTDGTDIDCTSDAPGGDGLASCRISLSRRGSDPSNSAGTSAYSSGNTNRCTPYVSLGNGSSMRACIQCQ